jgi:hypothetical protein
MVSSHFAITASARIAVERTRDYDPIVADIRLQARERGLAVVALGALCHHNSRHIGLWDGFHESATVFARKWSHRLPVATPCVIIDRGGEVRILGNATPGPRSIAYAFPRRGAFAITRRGNWRSSPTR